MNSKEHVLVIRCSDGMTSKPEQIKKYWAHEIRLPGGILFSDLYARENSRADAHELLRNMIDYAIETMVTLKSPCRIYLMAHNPCGAAGALGLDDQVVTEKLNRWQERIFDWFSIPVEVIFEAHSECGMRRTPHLLLSCCEHKPQAIM